MFFFVSNSLANTREKGKFQMLKMEVRCFPSDRETEKETYYKTENNCWSFSLTTRERAFKYQTHIHLWECLYYNLKKIQNVMIYVSTFNTMIGW